VSRSDIGGEVPVVAGLACEACEGVGATLRRVSDYAFSLHSCTFCHGTGYIAFDLPDADLAELRAAYSSTVRAHVEAAHARDRLWWSAWCLMWAAIGLAEAMLVMEDTVRAGLGVVR
jgi:hypothetical protein